MRFEQSTEEDRCDKEIARIKTCRECVFEVLCRLERIREKNLSNNNIKMETKKAELVDRLNAINRRIEEQGLGVDKKLLQIREKIKQELDLYSKWKKDGRNN